MKNIAVLAIIPFFSFAYEITGKVIHVADGDTVTIMRPNYFKHKVRLSGIDAPEKSQPFGDKSRQLLRQLIGGQNVVADCSGKDKYRRDICTIIKDGHDINAELVKNGRAWVYRQYYRGSVYYDYENQAKQNKRGLWRTSEAQAIPPWEWRKGATNDVNAPPVKLSKSKICHEMGTKYYNRVKRYKRFETIEKCLQIGRLPKR